MNQPVRAKRVLLVINSRNVLWLQREGPKLLFLGFFFFLPEPQRENREEHQCSFWVRTSNICERDSQPGGGGSLMYPPSLDISGCLELPNRILASIHWCM